MFVLWYPDSASAVHPFMAVLLALAVDALIGDPAVLYRRLPHPVAALGKLIAALEKWLNRPDAASRLQRGFAVTLFVVAGAAAVGWAIGYGLSRAPGGWIIEAALASALIAGRGLYDHARRVARGLTRSLEDGRAAVGHIVGRDTEKLDAPGVARAAIESLAENFSDGVVAPVLWYAALGLPGLAAYKAINTLDSMIGHRDPRHAEFGRFAARLDDVANWIPARIAGGLIVLAALWRAPVALWTMFRDAGKHRSVNAGWLEAPMAGALGIALAGPRKYGAETVEDAWMGSGGREANTGDIRRALRIYLRAWVLLAIFAVAALAL